MPWQQIEGQSSSQSFTESIQAEPTEWTSKCWAALGQHPGALWHLSHHLSLFQVHIPPSLPPLHSQKAASCHSLSPVSAGHTMVAATEARSGSPSSSELWPGHTMPVMDRPHHQGPNPDLYSNQLVLIRGY